MFNWLDRIPYLPLIVVSVLLLLAPYRPMPHVIEKLLLLKNGTLTKPMDIFDLIFHLFPTLLLIIKIIRHLGR